MAVNQIYNWHVQRNNIRDFACTAAAITVVLIINYNNNIMRLTIAASTDDKIWAIRSAERFRVKYNNARWKWTFLSFDCIKILLESRACQLMNSSVNIPSRPNEMEILLNCLTVREYAISADTRFQARQGFFFTRCPNFKFWRNSMFIYYYVNFKLSVYRPIFIRYQTLSLYSLLMSYISCKYIFFLKIP